MYDFNVLKQTFVKTNTTILNLFGYAFIGLDLSAIDILGILFNSAHVLREQSFFKPLLSNIKKTALTHEAAMLGINVGMGILNSASHHNVIRDQIQTACVHNLKRLRNEAREGCTAELETS